MSDHAATAHEHPNYVKIWAILLVLLAISVAGPFLEIPVVTLITAFGIAIVKAYMVAKNFMHLNIERQYVVYLIMTMLVFVLLFFAGTSPDVMKWEGDNWVKPKVEQASSHATHHDTAPDAAHHAE
jgi:caa(3)-type oxidase subunit IV